jgi:hypothetical protein
VLSSLPRNSRWATVGSRTSIRKATALWGLRSASQSGRKPRSRRFTDSSNSAARGCDGYSSRLASAPCVATTRSSHGLTWSFSTSMCASGIAGNDFLSDTSHSANAVSRARSHSARSASRSARVTEVSERPPAVFTAWPAASSRSRASLISEISSSTQNSFEMNLPAGLQMRELAVVALARGNHEIVVGGLHASRTVLERPILDEVVNGLRMKRVFVHAELRRPRGWIPR